MSWTPIVLDVDLDFLVVGTGTLRQEPEKPVWCSGDRLIEQLDAAGLIGTKVEVFLDQEASLATWLSLDLHDAIALHVDAHRDVYAYQSGATRQPSGVRGTVIGCGDYLYYALRDGVLREVLQVVPDSIRLEDAARDIRESCPEDIAHRISLTRLGQLRDAVAAFRIQGPPVITTVAVSPFWLPPSAWPEAERTLSLLGIDEPMRRDLFERTSQRWAQLDVG